jgi:hypothetical protein
MRMHAHRASTSTATATVCRMEEEPAAVPVVPRSRVMRLFDMTQIAAARIVDARNALPLLQFAHLSRAHLLQDICLQVRRHLCMLGICAAQAAHAAQRAVGCDLAHTCRSS